MRSARRTQFDQHLTVWTKRRILSWTLFVAAGLIAGLHLLAHAGWRPIPLSMGWQDIAIGYPTALVLAIIGAMALDPNPRL